MSTAQYKRIAWGAAHAATHPKSQFDPVIGDSSGAVLSAEGNPPVPSPQLQQPPPYQPRPSSSSQLTLPPPSTPSSGSGFRRTRGKLDISPERNQTRSELLREAYFPDWRDDASSADLENPDEMQKKDPLATQIWKLYNKTKLQLPNHERMENMTWRMMAMSLKKKEREQARYACEIWLMHRGARIGTEG